MTWEDFMAARQVLAEERVGTRVRDAQRAEDAAVDATRKALGRQRASEGRVHGAR